MKTILSLLLLLFVLASCESEGQFTSDDLRTNEVAPNAVLQFEGFFVPTSGINVEGGVQIYQNPSGFELKLNDFNISNGPDLKVYLSKSESPNEFINLGNLTNSTYSFPAQTDLSEYDHVLIHCQQYNHLFAICKLIQL